jgi:uncharacterized protein DUF4388
LGRGFFEGDVGLSGTLHTFPLPDLLQWVDSARKTGTLAVRGDRYTKRVYLKEGRIISSASDDPTEQLGQFLLSHGRITEEQLRKGLETQARTHVLLGKILLMVGALEEEELRRLLILKAEETIFSLFLWTDAHFDFLEGELPRELFVPIGLEVRDVLMKGLTMIDELRLIRSDFGSSRSVLAMSGRSLPPGFPPERTLASAVLALVDGRRSIADICLALHASEFTVSHLLFEFFEKGFLKLAQKAVPEGRHEDDRPFLSPEALVSQGRELLAAGRAEEAVELLRQAVDAAPRNLEAKKLFDLACTDFREKAYRHFLPPQSVPVLARQLGDLTEERLTPEEVFLISRINGSWDLKSIVDISPLGEVEALRILKRLKDRRIIELR